MSGLVYKLQISGPGGGLLNLPGGNSGGAIGIEGKLTNLQAKQFTLETTVKEND